MTNPSEGLIVTVAVEIANSETQVRLSVEQFDRSGRVEIFFESSRGE